MNWRAPTTRSPLSGLRAGDPAVRAVSRNDRFRVRWVLRGNACWSRLCGPLAVATATQPNELAGTNYTKSAFADCALRVRRTVGAPRQRPLEARPRGPLAVAA